MSEKKFTDKNYPIDPSINNPSYEKQTMERTSKRDSLVKIFPSIVVLAHDVIHVDY